MQNRPTFTLEQMRIRAHDIIEGTVVSETDTLVGPLTDSEPAIEKTLTLAFNSTLKEALGPDLAGYFNVKVSKHKKDKICRVLVTFSGNTAAVAMNKDPVDALDFAFSRVLSPMLYKLKTDLEQVIDKIPATIEEYYGRSRSKVA
jgi:hypothetical protein